MINNLSVLLTAEIIQIIQKHTDFIHLTMENGIDGKREGYTFSGHT